MSEEHINKFMKYLIIIQQEEREEIEKYLLTNLIQITEDGIIEIEGIAGGKGYPRGIQRYMHKMSDHDWINGFTHIQREG